MADRHVAEEGLEDEEVVGLRGLQCVGDVLADGAGVHLVVAPARLPHKARQPLCGQKAFL